MRQLSLLCTLSRKSRVLWAAQGMLLAWVATFGLSGCTTGAYSVGVDAALGATVGGMVRSGQAPVSGSSVELYAVGGSGTGSAATPLLSQPEVTDAEGRFHLGGSYACPSGSTLVYVVASGGNPGLAGGVENQALTLMSALGRCDGLYAYASIIVNEVTTVAAVASLAPYMYSVGSVGSSAGDAAGLAAGFVLAANLADGSSGSTPGAKTPEGFTVPASVINSAADVLARCGGSSGGRAGDGSGCGLLFSYATADGEEAPGSTAEAALAMVNHPDSNVSALFGLIATGAPFQPQLAEPPANWRIGLIGGAATPIFSSEPSGDNVEVKLADASAGAAIFYTANGSTPTTASARYTGAITLGVSTTLKAVAVAGRYTSAVAVESFTVAPAAPRASKLVFLTEPRSGASGAVLNPAITVAVEDSKGDLVSAGNLPVTLQLGAKPFGATLNGTLSVAAVNGVASFGDLRLAVEGQGYTLVASSPNLTPATSVSFASTPPPAAPLPLVAARAADSFVDSIGVDVHFNYYGSIYTNNVPLMIQSLKTLGVRHLRDAMCWQGSTPQNTFYLLHKQLGSLGFKTDYVPGYGQPMSQILAYPGLVPDMEAVESANEYDNSGDVNWVANITAQQTAIYRGLRASGANSKITVLGPSLAQPLNAPLLGNVSGVADAGNLHGYFGGFNPGSTTINPGDYLREIQQNTPLKSIWVTETGYFAQPGPIFGMYGVSEAAQAIYFPRDLLEYASAGAARVYMYELADDWEPGQNAAEYHWGLLRSDGTAKPAFGAVAGLLTMLADPGAAFAPAALGLSLVGGDANVHHTLFQKRDGSYYLALWVEASSYDFLKQQPITVPSQNVTLELARSVVSAERSQWDQAGKVTAAALAPSQAIALSVSDKLQVIKLVLR